MDNMYIHENTNNIRPTDTHPKNSYRQQTWNYSKKYLNRNEPTTKDNKEKSKPQTETIKGL